jgi:hypothetical protein
MRRDARAAQFYSAPNRGSAQGMELVVDSEQGKEGGARGRPSARRDSSEISQTIGDRREDIFIRVPDSPAPPAKRQIELHALPPNTNRAHPACSALALRADARLRTRLAPAYPHRGGVVPLLRAYSRRSDHLIPLFFVAGAHPGPRRRQVNQTVFVLFHLPSPWIGPTLSPNMYAPKVLIQRCGSTPFSPI